MSKKPKTCPKCGSKQVAEIMYGEPIVESKELDRDLDAGLVVLGGCCVSVGESPLWECVACEHQWGQVPSE